MKPNAGVILMLACAQVTLGAPQFTGIQPRKQSTEHFEIEPRELFTGIQPRKQTTEHREIEPREGGPDTIPPGAVNDEGPAQGISMVPFETSKVISMVPFIEDQEELRNGHMTEEPFVINPREHSTIPPGAVNEERSDNMSGIMWLLHAFNL